MATTIDDTLKDAEGNPTKGYLVISWPAMKTTGGVSVAPGMRRVVLVAGRINIALEPNDTSTPSGTTYAVKYFLDDGTRKSESWSVPTGGTKKVHEVRVAITPVPLTAVQLTQLAQGGATNGQDLRWNDTNKRWEPNTLFDAVNPASLGVVGPGSQTIAARRDHIHTAADLSTSQVTGVLAAARFPALTGDVTTSAGALATTIANSVVTSAKLDEKTVKYAEVSIGPAAVGTLRGTPFTLVAAPGVGKILEFISIIGILDWTTPAFTETADNLVVRYADGSGVIVSQTIEMTGFIDSVADIATNGLPKIDVIATKAQCENVALVLHNTGDGEFGGSGGSTLRVKVAYRVHSTGW